MLLSVKSFYETNTRRFVRFGGGRVDKVIHREVWGDGVETRREAFQYCHRLILDRLPAEHNPVRVLDLGCGIGSSLKYLQAQAGSQMEGIGVSISPMQVMQARQLVPECSFLEADFTNLPDLAPIHIAYAIEAFVHGPDAAGFFEEVAGLLSPGGFLYLIDDFLLTGDENQYLKRFRDGWALGSLLPVAAVEKHAQNVGLQVIEDLDLTRYLNLGRPRDIIYKSHGQNSRYPQT